MKTLKKIAVLALMLFTTDAFAADMAGLIAQAPEQAMTFKREGDKLFRMGDTEGAIASYQKAVASDTKLSAAWFNLAIARYTKRDLEGTREALEQVIRADADDAESHYNLGCLLLYAGDMDKARAHFDKASHCAQVEPIVSEQLTRATTYLNFLETCSPSQRREILRLLQDGLEPIGSN